MKGVLWVVRENDRYALDRALVILRRQARINRSRSRFDVSFNKSTENESRTSRNCQVVSLKVVVFARIVTTML